MQTIKTILEYSSVWIILLPLIIGLLCIKNLHHNSIIIFALVVVAAIPQLLPPNTFKKPLFNISYNIYTLLEFALLLLLFYKNYFSRSKKIIIVASAIVYYLIAVYYFIVFSIGSQFINQLACINNLFYVFWIILYVLEIEKKSTILSNSNGYNYYLFGILQYAACSTFILSVYHLKHENIILNTLWIFQSIPNIVMYILFAIGFFIDAKKNNVKKMIPIN